MIYLELEIPDIDLQKVYSKNIITNDIDILENCGNSYDFIKDN